jgi:hypothetical protein
LKRYLRLTVHKVVPVKAVLGRAVLVGLEVPMFNNKRKS